jgi:serine/threonine protein kinase/tetratricopeptide (TPR) repeat protein
MILTPGSLGLSRGMSPSVLRADNEEQEGPSPSDSRLILDDFTERWGRGDVGDAGDYLARLGAADRPLAAQLIYRDYCLAELAGRHPDPGSYLDRFPEFRTLLERVFALHGDLPDSLPGGPVDASSGGVALPEVGHEIGPYVLLRELGRGSFARVFLAEQADLENRLVVVKVSTRSTREPWLLARACHASIVEILTHAQVDDGAFQLISMPFLGGATLSAVLDHRRRYPRARASRGGLLRDLNAVAAPEYTEVNATHPARELLATLADPAAMAWVTARLAEALDHAFGRGVAHGDVKPSNILLTAHGTPMLLDFNLARDWPLGEAAHPVGEPGGTLAYMPPERLRAIASACAAAGRPARDPEQPRANRGRATDDPHPADLYSLGMVLLESLTGGAPPPTTFNPRRGFRGQPALHVLADDYASFRERGAEEVIRTAESGTGRQVPPGLRAVLRQCLAVEPAARYRRGTELAEDLDRWRTDRPLAYATEPFWRQTLPRKMRRSGKAMAVCAAVAVVCFLGSWLAASRIGAASQARSKLSGIWDAPDSGTFALQRPGRLPRRGPRENPLETPARALDKYEVLSVADWRQRDDVRALPAAERDELEAWILEQSLRYSRDLESRPASPAEWWRAIRLLDRVDTIPRLQALDATRRRLMTRLQESGLQDALDRTVHRFPLGLPAGPRAVETAGPPRAAWLDHYLLGVDAEIDEQHAMTASDGSLLVHPAELPGSRRAIEQYDRVLDLRHDSFWGHYRAAAVCFRLGRWGEAAGHLDHCCKLRPENSVLHGLLASCLGTGGYLDEALKECDRALDIAPDHAEFYRTRAFIRAEQQQTQGLKEDLERFELLSGFFARNLPATHAHVPGDPPSNAQPASHLALDFASGRGVEQSSFAPPADLDRDELDARIVLAEDIRKAGAPTIAADEVDKILVLDPNHLAARIERTMQAVGLGHFDRARAEMDTVLAHDHLFDYLRADAENPRFLALSARIFAARGLDRDALRIAEKFVSFGLERGESRGLAHYTMAAVHGIAARTDPDRISPVVKHLKLAFRANARYLEWYHRASLFGPLRRQIDAALDQMPDPTWRF